MIKIQSASRNFSIKPRNLGEKQKALVPVQKFRFDLESGSFSMIEVQKAQLTILSSLKTTIVLLNAGVDV